MSYLGSAGLRHVSVPIKHRRAQVVSDGSSSNCNMGSGHGCSSGSSGRTSLNVFSAIHEGAPLFAETVIGESDSRPFNTAILPPQSMSNNIDFNLRVSNIMLRFYRWTRSRRFDANIDLNSFDDRVSNSEEHSGDSPSSSNCQLCSPWDLGYSWSTCDGNHDYVLHTINFVPDEDMYVIKFIKCFLVHVVLIVHIW